MLTCLKRFVSNERRAAHAQKRGPQEGLLSLDELMANPDMPFEQADSMTPEAIFQKAWATEVVRRVLKHLEIECGRTGKTVHFEIFSKRVIGPILDGCCEPSMADLGRKHGLTEKQAANHLLTAKRAYQRLLSSYVGNTKYDRAPELPANLYDFPGDGNTGGEPVYTPLNDEFPEYAVLTESAPPNGDYDAVRNYGQYEDRRAISLYIRFIPMKVRTELRRYSERRWHLLGLFARCPGAMDLSHSNPALLFALASNWAFHKPAVKMPVRAARSLINRKQRVILKWLGFSATESVRRLLAKISPDALTVPRLLWLREHLPDPACLALLQHLPRINDTVLRLVTSRRVRPHLTPRLLLDLCVIEKGNHKWSFLPQLTLLYDTLRMCEAVNWERCPVLFRSQEAVEALHRDLGWRIAWVLRMRKGVSYQRLPAPPFPGTEWIRPLKTVEAIAREAWEQEHCAASYISLVAEGRQYLYCVLKPLRGTLAISRYTGTRRWYPSQFRQAANAPVPETIVKSTFEALFTSGKAQKQATVG